MLPHVQETAEAQLERTERLRALRRDFLDHTQTKVAPQKPRNVMLAVALTAVMLLLCIVGAIAFFQLKPILFASGGQSVATAFMDAMQKSDYAGAFSNCSNSVQEVNNTQKRLLSERDFVNQAQAVDKAAGPITNYTQTSSTSVDSNNVQYTFTITRKHKDIPNVTLVLTKSSDGSWKISSIDNALLTPPPSASPTASPPPASPSALSGGANGAVNSAPHQPIFVVLVDRN